MSSENSNDWIFKEYKLAGGHGFAIKSQKIDECLKSMQEQGIKHIAINSMWGWNRARSLDFLLENPWIEGVEIIDEDLDLSQLNSLKNLKKLHITGTFKGKIDLLNFEHLEYCSIKWDKKILNLGKAVKLNYLNISRFALQDLTFLSPLTNLTTLKLVYGYSQSLKGIGTMKRLKTLGMTIMLKLSNIDSLEEIGNNLAWLSMSSCKKVQDYSFFKRLSALQYINLGDGPAIESLDFLKNTKVTKGFIGLKVLDTNLDLLTGTDITYWKYKEYDKKKIK